MNGSSKPWDNPASVPQEITLAHALELPYGRDFVAHPPRMPMDVMLDYCEELLARRSIASVLAEPDRFKSSIEFEIKP